MKMLMTLPVRCVGWTFKILSGGIVIALAGCVMVILPEENPPPTMTQETTVIVTPDESTQEQNEADVLDEPPAMVPQVIEREIKVACTVPPYPAPLGIPTLDGIDTTTILTPLDTENLLIDHIQALRLFIDEREKEYSRHYQTTIDNCR